MSFPPCPICGSGRNEIQFTYSEAPHGEISFGLFPDREYFRRYFRCLACAHFHTDFRFPEKGLYEGDYVSATYKGLDGLRTTFAKIRALPPEKSDNRGRVAYIQSSLPKLKREATSPLAMLDVGSGLGVFPFAMREAGFKSTALDPDATACQHMRIDLGLDVIEGDFFAVQAEPRFHLVTFNKVLEHVVDPISMLRRAKEFLAGKDSFVYVELPDGELAGKDDLGKGREEFFIDHLHVFSFASMAILAEKAGFEVRTMERLQEPSTKYTLRGFLSPLPR
jgi:hypothetical protein